MSLKVSKAYSIIRIWTNTRLGEVRVTALDVEGGSFVDDLKKGDLW